jgi:hypothetical protein
MTGRLERSGNNVRRIAARIFPALAAERLAPGALTDLFTDPLDLAAALFASRLAGTGDVQRDQPPATDVNRPPPLEKAVDHRSRAAQAREFIPPATRASQPFRFTQTGPPLQPSTIANAFARTQESKPTVRSPQQLAAGTRGESARGASAEQAITPKGSTAIGWTHGSVEQAPATALPSRPGSLLPKPIDRTTPFAPLAPTNDRVRALAHAAVPTTAGEPAAAPQPGSSTRAGATAGDDVTRWVKGAAGLATLFAPPQPAAAAAAPAASPAAGSPPALSQPVALDNAATASVDSPARPQFIAPFASTDVELLMDELERRLELEYLRHYGTSGR